MRRRLTVTQNGCRPAVVGSTPLFTRHMRGAIEAERDHRHRQHEARWPLAYTTQPHPEAVLGLPQLRIAATEADLDRWSDEGGSLPSELLPGRLR
jgi:hypothetical protein